MAKFTNAIFFVFAFLTILNTFHFAHGENSIRLEDYVKAVIGGSPRANLIKEDMITSKAEYESKTDFMYSKFSLTGGTESTKNDLVVGPIRQQEDDAVQFGEIGWELETPWGAQLAVGVGQRWPDSTLVNTRPQFYTKATWTQSLLRNFLGRRSRLSQASSGLERSQGQAVYKKSLIQLCHEAVGDYLSAFVHQQTFEALKRIQRQTDRSVNIVQRAYKQGRISKASWLYIQAEALSIQNQLLNSQLQAQVSQSQLSQNLSSSNSQISLQGPIQLQSPESAFEKVPVEVPLNLESNLMVQELELSVQQAQKKYELSQLDTRSDITFKMSVQDADTNYEVQSQVGDVHSQTLTATLGVGFRLFDGSLKAHRAVAYGGWQRKVHEFAMAQLDVKNQWAEAKQLKTYYQKLHLNRLQQLKLKVQNVKESQRLLSAGKVDIYNFVTDQNSWIQTELDVLQTKFDLWKTYLTLLSLNGSSHPACQLEGALE